MRTTRNAMFVLMVIGWLVCSETRPLTWSAGAGAQEETSFLSTYDCSTPVDWRPWDNAITTWCNCEGGPEACASASGFCSDAEDFCDEVCDGLGYVRVCTPENVGYVECGCILGG